ncbi:MAG: hypothetical protein ACI4UV_15815 [Victivallales bacterium]
MTDIYLIAEAAARHLNSAKLLPEEVSAYADPLPEFELEELNELKIIFVPVNSRLEASSRSENLETSVITVGILKHLSGKDEIKELVALEQSILEWFRHQEFPAGAKRCHCVGSETETLFDGEAAKTQNNFFAVIELEIEVYGEAC